MMEEIWVSGIEDMSVQGMNFGVRDGGLQRNHANIGCMQRTRASWKLVHGGWFKGFQRGCKIGWSSM